MVAAPGPGRSPVLRQTAPEGGPGAAHQRVRPDAHDTAAAARAGAGLAVLGEEVDTPSWPFHRAGTVGQHAEAADADCEAVEKVVEPGGVGDARIHDRSRPR